MVFHTLPAVFIASRGSIRTEPHNYNSAQCLVILLFLRGRVSLQEHVPQESFVWKAGFPLQGAFLWLPRRPQATQTNKASTIWCFTTDPQTRFHFVGRVEAVGHRFMTRTSIDRR